MWVWLAATEAGTSQGFSVSTEFKLWSKDKMPTDWVIQSVPNLLLLR